MEKKQFHRRGLGMLLLLAVILFGLGSSLYDAQMIHGAEYLEQSRRKIAKTETVEAARASIPADAQEVPSAEPEAPAPTAEAEPEAVDISAL